MIRSSKRLLAISATTYLVLALGVGVHAAFILVIAAAFVAGWIWLAARFPTVGWLTYIFFNSFVLGLISGLLNYQSGYTYRARYLRRRR